MFHTETKHKRFTPQKHNVLHKRFIAKNWTKHFYLQNLSVFFFSSQARLTPFVVSES